MLNLTEQLSLTTDGQGMRHIFEIYRHVKIDPVTMLTTLQLSNTGSANQRFTT